MKNVDHLAQTFLVQEPFGVILTKVSLFFQAKPSSTTAPPVRFEIRTMKNEYPGDFVVPFSSIVLKPSEIKVSTDGVNMSTDVEFKNPVFLKNLGNGTEYCFVLVTTSTEYVMWITNTDNPAVTKSPYIGRMFKTSNNFQLIASEQETLVFKMYRAQFTNANAPANILLENNYDNKRGIGYRGSNPNEIKYNIVYPNIEFSQPTGTTVNMDLKTRKIDPSNPNAAIDSDGSGCLNRQNNFFESEKIIKTDNLQSVELQVTMDTNNEYVSPIISLGGLAAPPSLRLIGNVINKPTTLLKSDGTHNIDDNIDNVTAKYITQPIYLQNESTYLDIKMGTHVPSEADIYVYYRTAVSSIDNIEDIDFKHVNPENTILKSSVGSEIFHETVFILEEELEVFDVFEVMILMVSTNTSIVPKVKDLRIIAGA